jgi:hypothetical protein
MGRFLMAGLLVLAGCATMNENECRTADWYQIGLRDGRDGEPASHLEAHRRACAEYGIQPRNQRYLDGRDQGLAEYCKLGNAFRTGLNGQQYQGVCPAPADLDFLRYNMAAYTVYRLRNDVSQAQSALETKEYRLNKDKLSDKDAKRLRDDIHQLDHRLIRLRGELHEREQELGLLMDEARYER